MHLSTIYLLLSSREAICALISSFSLLNLRLSDYIYAHLLTFILFLNRYSFDFVSTRLISFNCALFWCSFIMLAISFYFYTAIPNVF
jgi:hypothetical protein